MLNVGTPRGVDRATEVAEEVATMTIGDTMTAGELDTVEAEVIMEASARANGIYYTARIVFLFLSEPSI